MSAIPQSEPDDVEIDVVFKQHLSDKEFRDEEAKSTLRVFATSTQTVGKAGVQRVSFLEIKKDASLSIAEQCIAKTLSPADIKQIDAASLEILTAIDNFRPSFPRPLFEFSASAYDGVTVGAVRKASRGWMCFIELADDVNRLRCSIGDFERFDEFRSALIQAGNF